MKKIYQLLNMLFFLFSRFYKIIPFLVLLLFLFTPDYSFAQQQDWQNMELQTTQGANIAPAHIKGENGLLLLFMDPDCPVTQKYGATIRELHQTYGEEGVAMAAVYPVVNAEPEKIREFAEDYQYPFTHLLDPKLEFTKAIGASITPEVFLLDTAGKILYQGAIDNWFYELGRYRRVITEHYLKDALKAHLVGKPVPTEKTKAVGCMIGTGMLHHSDHH